MTEFFVLRGFLPLEHYFPGQKWKNVLASGYGGVVQNVILEWVELYSLPLLIPLPLLSSGRCPCAP